MPHNHNHLIALLPREDRLHLLSVCEQVELTLAQVICVSGALLPHAYFPNEGAISLVAAVDRHAGLSVGMVGREGMLGTHLACGVATAPLQALVQGAGLAWRVDRIAFRSQLLHSVPLQCVLGCYSYVTMAQFSLSIGCQRFHALEARLARWLLMRHDRAQSDRLLVTQDSLGHMLGVRRVGVTIAAGALQAQGLITYTRGTLTVLDRRRLEHAACSCYARDRGLYAEFMPSAATIAKQTGAP